MKQKTYADAAELATDKKITLAATEHIFLHFGPGATSCHAAVRQLFRGKVAPGEYPMPTKDQIGMTAGLLTDGEWVTLIDPHRVIASFTGHQRCGDVEALMATNKIDLSTPAKFISSPGGAIQEFERLDLALLHAHGLTSMRRHPRAQIDVLDSQFGWVEIEELISQYRIGDLGPSPTRSTTPRSSRT